MYDESSWHYKIFEGLDFTGGNQIKKDFYMIFDGKLPVGDPINTRLKAEVMVEWLICMPFMLKWLDQAVGDMKSMQDGEDE